MKYGWQLAINGVLKGKYYGSHHLTLLLISWIIRQYTFNMFTDDTKLMERFIH